MAIFVSLLASLVYDFLAPKKHCTFLIIRMEYLCPYLEEFRIVSGDVYSQKINIFLEYQFHLRVNNLKVLSSVVDETKQGSIRHS